MQGEERPDLTADEIALLERKMGSDQKYTQKQMFREEIESPFRKTRLFLIPAFAASAALGAFISGTRLIAASTGVTGYDVAETAQNLAVNMAAVVGLTVFYFNDKRARDLDLERIARSGKLSTLSIRLKSESGKEVLFAMKTFRKARRFAIVVGGPQAVAEAREMATLGQEPLSQVGAIVVPCLWKDYSGDKDGDALPSSAADAGWLLPCLAAPVREEEWKEWLQAEVDQARSQGLDLDKGVTIYVERSGYIKKRTAGVPAWQVLAEETRARNRPYGMPEIGVDY